MTDDVLVNKIYEFRGQKVMLDSDLAELYRVETRRLKDQVRRNIIRFPEHFMFELNKEEYGSVLRSQNATSEQGRYSKYLPDRLQEKQDNSPTAPKVKKVIGFKIGDK
ncbi:ORF6N domain-containing protein [Sphingobacterium sp. SGR-19]|nr:ORF6N domain-containing protein [Sphingobacterium sp. SGR-19]